MNDPEHQPAENAADDKNPHPSAETTDNSAANSPEAADRPSDAAAGQDGLEASEAGAETAQSGPLVGEDELPEFEPLTPEIAEEEAIRNDFMMRWAVILIAFLFAFTQCANTETLVHVKAGQYLADHGFLPSGVDTLSYSASGRPWLHLSWLYDLAVAGLYSLQGAGMLSLFKAVLAAVAIGFAVHTSIRDVSTWFGSICGALAIAVCYPLFVATPELITLVGVALTLYLLREWDQEAGRFSLRLALLIALWSNLDSRVWIGVLLVVLYAAGREIGRVVGTPSSGATGPLRSALALAASCVVAALFNPFLWNSLTVAVQQYADIYPAQRLYHPITAEIAPPAGYLAYYSMLSPVFWTWIDPSAIVGLTLLLIAVVALILNRSELDGAHVALLLGFTGLAIAASHELPAAALVAAVVASVNAQAWYRRSFRQEYSIATSDLAFSVGGRVVTVLALIAFAFWGVSGRLTGSEGARIGFGFDNNLAEVIRGVEQDLANVPIDDKLFNFTPDQGDLLIWSGRPSFIDSRIGVFATGQDDLIALHDTTRRAIRRKRSETDTTAEKPDVWKATFDKYEIAGAIPRMYGAKPDQHTQLDMQSSDDWTLVQPGSTCSVYYRRDWGTADGSPSTTIKPWDVVQAAFRVPLASDAAAQTRQSPRPPSFYDEYLMKPQASRSAALMNAQHSFSQMVQQPAPVQHLAGLAILTIRHANQALIEDPQDIMAYLLLGRCYDQLSRIEDRITGGGTSTSTLRYYQSLNCLNQAAVIEPTRLDTQLALFQAYSQRNRMDVALRSLERLLELIDEDPDRMVMSADNLRENYRLRNQLKDVVDQQVEQIDGFLAEFDKQMQSAASDVPLTDPAAIPAGPGMPETPAIPGAPMSGDGAGADRMLLIRELIGVADRVAQQGFVLQSLRMLEAYPESWQRDLGGQYLYGRLQLEAGQTEDAFLTLARVESVADEMPAEAAGVPWQFSMAVATLANGNYQHASRIWSQQAQMLETSIASPMSTINAMRALPLISPPAAWPLLQLQSLTAPLATTVEQVADLQLNVGLCYLESGRIHESGALFRQVLESGRETSSVPLAAFYLAQISGDDFASLVPGGDWEPLEPQSAPDSAEASNPESSESESSTAAPAEAKPASTETTPKDPQATNPDSGKEPVPTTEKKPADKQPADKQPTVDTPAGDKPDGDKLDGDKAADDKPADDKATADTPADEKSAD